jgi:hypothetical protein
MQVNQAGTATYFARHLRNNNHSPFSSELHNSHKRLNLLSSKLSNSNSSNNSREYHRQHSPNNQQINKTTNKRSSNRQISPAVVATNSRHLVYVPMATCSSRQTATEV